MTQMRERWARDAAKREAQTQGRTKSELRAQMVAMRQEEEDAWRAQGKALGLLDDDTRPSAPHSHVPDAPPAVMPWTHEVQHESFDAAPMSSQFLSAIHAAERTNAAVKVI